MLSMHFALALVQGASSPSLWQNVVEALPNDPASLFTLALCVGVTVLVVVAGVSSNKKRGGPGGPLP